VEPGVAEPLVVLALCEAGLGFVSFDLYNDTADVMISESVLRLLGRGEGKLWLLNRQVRQT
jgi:hypothetical protein